MLDLWKQQKEKEKSEQSLKLGGSVICLYILLIKLSEYVDQIEHIAQCKLTCKHETFCLDECVVESKENPPYSTWMALRVPYSYFSLRTLWSQKAKESCI